MDKKNEITHSNSEVIRCTVTISEEDQKKYKDIYAWGQKNVTPCGKTLKDVEAYIIEKLNGRRKEIEEKAMRRLKVEIAMNLIIDDTDKEYQEVVEEAERICEDGYEFDIVVYELNEVHKSGNHAQIIIERNLEFFTSKFCSKMIRDELLEYYGVFKEDIDELTPRFILYIEGIRKKIEKEI